MDQVRELRGEPLPRLGIEREPRSGEIAGDRLDAPLPAGGERREARGADQLGAHPRLGLLPVLGADP